MRLFACHKLLCSVGILLMLGFTGYLQAQNNDHITLSLNNASLEKLIKAIEAQTSYRFVYTNEQLLETKPVTISIKDIPIKAALDQCFHDQPLIFSLEEKYIILHEKPADSKNELIDISGTVKNDRGDLVNGATVSIAGSDRATSTAADGSFSFTQISTNAILTFSGTDVETRQFPVHGQKTMSVILKTKTKNIDEVQVIGYGTTTKRLNTGDVSTVSSDVISQQPVMNTLAALEGRVAGLVITQDNGIPGSTFHVQIRGQNSISSGNDPFYVVDGVPFNSSPLTQNNVTAFHLSPFNNLNPGDIESVTVLKDADATAIYGSRGANGVILITTKKGKQGKTSLDINVYTGAGQVSGEMKLLHTPEYLAMRREAFKNDSYTPSPGRDPDILVWDTTRYTDWQKTLIGNTMHSTDAQANLSGGNINTQFLISGNFHHETTVFQGEFADNRGGMHFNLNHNSSDKKLSVTFSSVFSSDQNNLPPQDVSVYYMYLAPDAPPLYDSTGKLNWAGNTWTNPLATEHARYNTRTENLVSSLHLGYLLLPGLRIKADLGYTQSWMNEVIQYPQAARNPTYGSQSSAVFGNNQLKTWDIEPQLEYSSKVGPGKLEILVGLTFQQTTGNGYSVSASGYSSDALLNSITGASTILANTISDYRYKYAAVFGRINYNIEDELIFNFTGRRDGSSRFGPGKEFANFGAVGVAWIFSKYNWLQQNLSFLSFGKLRTSYGTTGNDQIGNYQYLSIYYPTYYTYMGETGLSPGNLSNPDYGWEVNKKFEAGIDLGFLKDRILTSVSYYNDQSSNQILSTPLPGITGFTSITANLPALVQNTGLEIDLNATIIKATQFSWKSSLNITFPNNKLISFPGLANSQYAYQYIIGEPLHVIKTYNLKGVDAQTGIYQFLDANGKTTFTPAYPKDVIPVNLSPKFYGGFFNSFQWRGWQMDIFFTATKQNGAVNIPNNAPGQLSNQNIDVLDRWQNTGDQSSVQKFTATFGPAYTAYRNALSSLKLTDASFVRLKNIALSYQFRPAFLTALHLSSLRLYIQGQNLITLTSYKGLDPETQGTLPPIKLLVAGLQLSL